MKKIFNPFTYIRKIRELIGKIMKSVKRSIRIQLITAFTACALLGLFVSTKIVAPVLKMLVDMLRLIIEMVWNKLIVKRKVLRK